MSLGLESELHSLLFLDLLLSGIAGSSLLCDPILGNCSIDVESDQSNCVAKFLEILELLCHLLLCLLALFLFLFPFLFLCLFLCPMATVLFLCPLTFLWPSHLSLVLDLLPNHVDDLLVHSILLASPILPHSTVILLDSSLLDLLGQWNLLPWQSEI